MFVRGAPVSIVQAVSSDPAPIVDDLRNAIGSNTDGLSQFVLRHTILGEKLVLQHIHRNPSRDPHASIDLLVD